MSGAATGRLALVLVLAGASAGAQSKLDDAKHFVATGEHERAIPLLEDVVGKEPSNFEAGSLLAWLFARTGRTARAIEEYERLAKLAPDDADVRNSLGALLFRERRFDEAARELENARRLDPKLVMAHYNYGLLNLERGAFATAAESFLRAVELDPRRANYHMALARAYRGAYRLEEATNAYRQGLSLEADGPNARMARLELALTHRQRGLLLEASEELRALLAVDGTDAEARFQLSRLHVALNRYADAEVELERLVSMHPDHVPGLFMLGFVRYRSENADGARAAFRRLLELAPDHAEGTCYLGMTEQKLGDAEGARAAFERAIELEPDHLTANYNLALLLAKSKDPGARERLDVFRRLSERREQLDMLEERVRWAPDNARYQFELGREYALQKRTEEALQAFQRALELDPNFAGAEVAISDLLGKR